MKKEDLAILMLSIIVIVILITTVFDNSSKTITGFVSLDKSASVNLPYDYNNYLEDELIIKYKDNVIGNGNEIIINDGKEILVYEYIEKPISSEKIISDEEFYSLKFDNDKKLDDIIDSYKNIPEIDYIEKNYIFEIENIPNDSNYTLQYGLKNINAEEAWNLTVGSKDVVIAIIDTGVEWAHEDLNGNIWNNSDESCDENFDLDNNSYRGDCRGYDFVDVSSDCSDSDCNNEDNNPTDSYGHGTHVAGIASASSNNIIGIAGACWNCSIMPIRTGYKTSSGNGVLTLADVVQALHYASDNNATIISMSFGGSDSIILQEAINYSKSILVASAGNEGKNTKRYPCSYDNVICVGATGSNNQSASYSNYGEWIDLSAPGSSILSTYTENSYKYLSGTSMATPVVAGSIGLIKSLFNLNQDEIKNVLNNTGTEIDFGGFKINRINIYSAVLSLDDIKPNVALVYPEGEKINLTLNQNFLCESKDWQLKNISFQIWNSSEDLFYSETREIFGIYDKSEFSVNLKEDSYKWNCLVYDNNSNHNYASDNFTISTVNFTINPTPTENPSYKNLNNIGFNCSVQSDPRKQIKNITFKLSNDSSLIYTETKELTGILNSTGFNYNFSEENVYYWTCEAYNNKTEFTKTNNFTIIYDITSPKINLLEPENGKSYDTKNNYEVDFKFEVIDKNDISNCNLILDNNVKETNNSIDKNSPQKFKSSFEPSNYNWNVLCVDRAGNFGNSEARTFKVVRESSEEKSSEDKSSGEGASSGDDSKGGGAESSISIPLEPPKKTYFISKEQFLNGYEKVLIKNDEIKFFFEEVKIFKHSLTLNKIENNIVEIIVRSNPINLELSVGEERKLNLTNANFYDLYIKINSMEENKANITIKLINEVIGENKEIDNLEGGITGLTVDEKANETYINNLVGFVTKSIGKESAKKSYLVYLILIILIFIVFFFIRKLKKKYSNERESEKKEL